MFPHRFLNLWVLMVMLVSAFFNSRPDLIKEKAETSPTSVVAWNAVAQRTIVANAKQSPSHAVVSMAYVQAAVYDAVVTIEGGFKPYALKHPRRPQASVDAAVAAAAHGVLVHYFPDQKAALDADLATALAAVPDGKARDAGVKVGQAAAKTLIALRANDGYMADTGFTMPAAGPGVWQLLPNQTPLIPWLAQMEPFLIDSPDQFRPEGPRAMSSAEYAADYNEVYEIGKKDSTTRTAEQTDAAFFFTGHPVPQYNFAYNGIINGQGLSAVEAARLYAMAYLVVADANIACYDAKYEFLFWRPQAAIQNGDLDGNSHTVVDLNWEPLIGTPPHPEYTSGHGCFTGSAAEVMAHFLGTRNIDIDLTTTAANVTQTVRHYDTVDDLLDEIVDVRVWSGIHFRSTNEDGVEIGTRVARWSLDRFFGRTR